MDQIKWTFIYKVFGLGLGFGLDYVTNNENTWKKQIL